jgi:hypothetical protein
MIASYWLCYGGYVFSASTSVSFAEMQEKAIANAAFGLN